MSFRSFAFTCLAACLALAGSARLASAAPNDQVGALKPDVLSVIPEDIYGFVVAADVPQTKVAVEQVLGKLGVPLDDPDYVEFGELLDKLADDGGWDTKRSLAVVLFTEGKHLVPPVMLVIPVTNYEKFAVSMGAEAPGKGPTSFKANEDFDGVMAEKNGFALLTPSPHEDYLRRVMADKGSIEKSIGPARDWIGRQQVGLVVTPFGLKTMFDAAINGLEQAKAGFPADAPQAGMVAGVFDTYAKILKTMRDEVTLLSVGGKIDAEAGVTLTVRADFRADGKFAAVAKDAAPLSADALKGLPEGEFFVAGAGVVSGDLMEDLMRFSMDLSRQIPPELGGVKLSDEDLAKVTEAVKQSMANVKSFSMKVDVSGTSMIDKIAGVIETTNAKEYLANYEKAITTLGALQANAAAAWPAQSVKRVTIDGREALEITTDVSGMLDKLGENQPEQAKQAVEAMLSMFLGADGKLSAYLAAADDDTVVMTYNRTLLAALIEGAAEGKAGLSGNEHLKKTAAMLPGESHAVGYVSIGGYVELIKKFFAVAAAATGDQGIFPQLPAFPAAPPIGAAVKINPTSVETTIAVPMQLIEAGRDYVLQMKAAR